jgi:hypothetical protein
MLASSTGAGKIVEILPIDPHPAFSLASAVLALSDFADDVKFIAVNVDAGAISGRAAAKTFRRDIFHGMASIVENVGAPPVAGGINYQIPGKSCPEGSTHRSA